MAPKQELDLLMRPDLRLPRLLPEMAKREPPSDPGLLVLLAAVKLETLLVIQRLPQENPPAEATQPVSESLMRLAAAMWQPGPVMLPEVIRPVSELAMRSALAM